MTELEKVKAWLAEFPDVDLLGQWQVDYADCIPGMGGIAPQGMVELARREDILGNSVVENQLNFGLYCTFLKAPGDDAGASFNADWVLRFQQWIQEQSAQRLAPRFGNGAGREVIRAENGALYEATEEGTALYLIALSVRYEMHYDVD